MSSALVACGFARIPCAARGVWFTCMLLTLMLAVQVIIITPYALFTKLSLTNLVEGSSTTGMKG